MVSDVSETPSEQKVKPEVKEVTQAAQQPAVVRTPPVISQTPLEPTEPPKPKNWLIIILLVLVVFGVGGYFVYKNLSVPDEDEVRKERIKNKIQEELEEEKTLQSSKSSRAICIETGGGVSSEFCEKIPLQGFESFESYKTWCLEIGGVPEMCTSFESSCKEFGLTTADKCFRISSNPEIWSSH